MGFSLLELMLVVVIIGLIAAIAIPRLSRGAAGTADAALSGNLVAMQEAIDRYSVEHGGAYPTAANVTNQLIQYSNSSGATQSTRDTSYFYGPYLRAIPPLPVGARIGQTGIATADAATVGWIYNATTGAIRANTTTETDATGKLYSSYGPNPVGSGTSSGSGSGSRWVPAVSPM